jgi:DnaK suppressor protein
MDEKTKEHFRAKLLAWREELIHDAAETVDDMSEEKAQFADPTDRATLETDRNFLLRIRDRERKLITKIDQALGRLKEDTFGECESCGGAIETKRLEARLVSTLCIACKAKQEEEEKLNKR